MIRRADLVAAVTASRAQDQWAQRWAAEQWLAASRPAELGPANSREIGDLAGLILEELKHRLSPIRSTVLLPLVEAHERLVGPSPSMTAGRAVQDAALVQESLRSGQRSAVAWLIETACRWAQGTQRPTPASLARLGALARLFQLLMWARDDAWKVQSVELTVTRDGLGVALHGNHSARLQVAVGGQGGLDYMREAEMKLAMKVAHRELGLFHHAIEEERGWSLSALRTIKLALDPAGSSTARLDSPTELVDSLASAGVSARGSEAFVRDMTITRDDEFDPGLPAFLPHRHGRSKGYASRLFVQCGDRLAWCPAHCDDVLTAWMLRAVTNRIRGEGKRVQDAARALSGRLDEEFNRRLARSLERGLRGWRVERNVTSIAGSALATPTGRLGDIDILVESVERRTVVAVECKRLSPALGPYETWVEHQKFDEAKGHLAKHAARGEWLDRNRDLLAGRLGVPASDLTIHAVIATSAAVPTAFRDGLTVPVIAWWDLLRWFQDDHAVGDGAFTPGALNREVAWTDL